MESNILQVKEENIQGYTLAIESSGILCGVALSYKNELLAEYYTAKPHLHDALLAEYIRRILADHSLKAEDIKQLVLSAGPGSFTGLRIGTALAKGFCFGTECRLYAVPTLVALAYNAWLQSGEKEKTVQALTLSHKNLLYVQEARFAEEFATGEVQLVPYENIEFSPQGISVASGWAASLPQKPDVLQIMPMRPSFLLNTMQLAPARFAVEATTFEPYYGQEFIPKQANIKSDE